MATKHKKRHSNSSAAVRQRAKAARIADDKDRYRKRMNPVARNILLGDLVFLAATAMLEQHGILPTTYSNVFAVIGALLIPVALYFQFVKKDGGPKSGPRLK